MKLKYTLLFVLSFAVFTASAQRYELKVMQKGKELKIRKKKVKVGKAPFQLVFVMKTPGEIGLNASVEAFNYQAAKNGADITNFPCFLPGTGLADYPLNEKKWMFVDPEGQNYWYYTDSQNSRFDKTRIENDRYVCTRTIERLWYDGYEIEANQIQTKYLYLVMTDHTPSYEGGLDYLRIKFVK